MKSLAALRGLRIVPVLVLEDVASGVAMCKALWDNGLPGAEITFRTPAAEAVIREAKRQFPELLLGAGTILNVYDLHRAFAAGASFAVAPGCNPTVVKEAARCGFDFAPGVCTPSEVEQALEFGTALLKFFPAEAAGGVKYLKALIAPYRHLGVNFMPTGGVTAENAADYLAVPEVAAVGGTWIGKASDIQAGNWTAVNGAIAAAAALARRMA